MYALLAISDLVRQNILFGTCCSYGLHTFPLTLPARIMCFAVDMQQGVGHPAAVNLPPPPVARPVSAKPRTLGAVPPIPAVHFTTVASEPLESPPPPVPMSSPRRASASKALNRDDITLGRMLGEGEFGAVRKGVYRQPDGRTVSHSRVVIKKRDLTCRSCSEVVVFSLLFTDLKAYWQGEIGNTVQNW